MQGDPPGQTKRWEFTELLGLDSLFMLSGILFANKLKGNIINIEI